MKGNKKILDNIKEELREIQNLDLDKKVELLNEVRKLIHEISPFKDHPVDLVQWIKADLVEGNEYNPNKVAPPEMKLLHMSIKEDGYTQPIVANWDEDIEKQIIVDGFHRGRVGKEYQDIQEATFGYLPLVPLNKSINERMASTIRHNRARGTHQVQSMSEIVAELYLKGWSNKRIAEQLGMEKDEINRLKQFAGLGDLFRNREFSNAWI